MSNKAETAPRRPHDTLINRQLLTEADPPFINLTDQGVAGLAYRLFTHISYTSGTASDLLQTPPETFEEAISDFVNAAKSVYVLLAKTSSTEESRSLQQPIPETIERIVAALFDAASDEEFEYGLTSQFASALGAIVHRYGVGGVETIQRHIGTGDVRVDSIIEALHTLARIQHTPSRSERLLLLLRNLFADSARVRCGAALGLAYLDDPKALPFLRQALERESSSSTRVCFQRVLEQLEDTERQG